MRRAFDRYMVDVELGSNPKVGRFTDREFRCLVCGVWALAAKAEPRGYLVVAGEPATSKDVAHQAHCSPSLATATLVKMRALDMLEFDEVEQLERCHDWDEINPAPKLDGTNAERQRRWRERRNAGHNAVTNGARNGAVTPPEVEVEVEVEGEVEDEVVVGDVVEVSSPPPQQASKLATASVSASQPAAGGGGGGDCLLAGGGGEGASPSSSHPFGDGELPNGTSPPHPASDEPRNGASERVNDAAQLTGVWAAKLRDYTGFVS